MKSIRKVLLLGAVLATGAALAASLFGHSPRAAEGLDKKEVQAIVREYLIENPEVVIEAIEAYQANQQEIEARRSKETIATRKSELFGKDLPYFGNPDGDVVIAEFFDYNCGYCKRALDEVIKVVENDPGIKIVFHEMPILSEASSEAARYAVAAHKQGKYFDYHRELMKFAGPKTTEALEKLAEKVGLDVEQLRKDAASREVRGQIEKSLTLSRDLGIRGTPAFVIGDTLAPGYLTHKNMLEVIAQVRENQG